MNFTRNEHGLEFGGSLQGVFQASYDELVKVFGEPGNNFDDYKSDASWIVKFEDGTVADIYNWKDGHNYNGEFGEDVENIDEWHVGGTSRHAFELVVKTVRENA